MFKFPSLAPGFPFSQSGMILKSSFDQGRYDKPFTGGDWNEYMKGKAEKEQYIKNAGGNQPGRPSGGGINNDGRAGGFWGKLILFLLGVLLAIPSFFTAILAGTILFFLLRALSNHDSIDMKRLYTGAFWGMFAYLATAAIMSFIVPLENSYGTESSSKFYIENIFLYFFSILTADNVSTESLLKFHLPCIIIATIVVHSIMGNQLGKLRFFKALSVVIVILLPSFIGLLYLTEYFMPAQLQYFVTLV